MEQPAIVHLISGELNIKDSSVINTVALLTEGATIPFIARYRKERTGGLDETEIKNISEKFEYYTELEKRKTTILETIRGQGKLTPELEKEIAACMEKQRLEDLYLPYKPKKRTRATIAREKGLLPLAEIIMEQETLKGGREEKIKIVSAYINEEKGVANYDEALAGALDIIAENISDNAQIRGWIREFTKSTGIIESKARKQWADKKSKYETYYNFSEPLLKSQSHRLLAIRRGAKEEVLSWKIAADNDKAIHKIESTIITNKQALFYTEILSAIADSYSRLIFPSLENEVFNHRLEEAEREAIVVFSKNLRNLLLSPPAGPKMIMGIDPGFRTGCKACVIDTNGNFKEYRAIFPHEPHNKTDEAESAVMGMIKKYGVELIAIGNGTASKETVQCINAIVKKNDITIIVITVSEAGASVYSASDTAIKEFPDLDVTVRGAISIARRLQDPLAELVKIDPKAIGVGQYQHDVNQAELKRSLDRTVESCVNFVGVDLNTASAELLSYISGIGETLARNIVRYRLDNGSFKKRKDLMNVAKLGSKAFEQCAGFLRIKEGDDPLDNSAIHPESYFLVGRIAKDIGVPLPNLIANDTAIATIQPSKYISGDIGLPTLNDIIQELKKPGLDPRREFSSIEFSSAINEITDLREEMELPGTVTNVTNFGAFVDIGVHQDGLIHISKLSKNFVKNPYEIVSVGDNVQVKILSIDAELKRISLELVSKVKNTRA